MSAFLGPIHFWLYNKIQIQVDITQDIIELDKSFGSEKQSLENILNEKYGKSERRPLEEVIDEGNIHGWLQNQVSISEYKLATAVTLLLEKKPDSLSTIETIFREKGKESSTFTENSQVAEVYKGLSDSLLDGMPCDHANSIVEENDHEVVWKRNTCVHKVYWDEVNGKIENYYKLRDAFIEGFIEPTGLKYEKIDETTSKISK